MKLSQKLLDYGIKDLVLCIVGYDKRFSFKLTPGVIYSNFQ